MRLIIVILVLLFGLLQYQLWFAPGGIMSAIHRHSTIQRDRELADRLIKRNQVLRAEIEDLQHGHDAIEAHARYDLGMVKKGEVFYQVVNQ